MRPTTSFWSEPKTTSLQKLLKPDIDRIRALLETLPKGDTAGDLDEVANTLCTHVKNAAASESGRHGWHRRSGRESAIGQLQNLENAAAALLAAMEQLRREALEQLSLHGVGHASHAPAIVELRQAARRSRLQLKGAGPGPPADKGPDRQILPERITFAAAAAFRRVTGLDPLGRHRLGARKAPAVFPDFLQSLFEVLGVTASAADQVRHLRKRRKATNTAPPDER